MPKIFSIFFLQDYKDEFCSFFFDRKLWKKTHFLKDFVQIFNCHWFLLNFSIIFHFSTVHTIEISLNTTLYRATTRKGLSWKWKILLQSFNPYHVLSLPNGEKLTRCKAHVLTKLYIPNVPSYHHHHRIPTCSQKVIFSVIFLFSPKIHCIHFIVQLQVNCSQSEERKGGVFALCDGVCACFCCPVCQQQHKLFHRQQTTLLTDCLYNNVYCVGRW